MKDLHEEGCIWSKPHRSWQPLYTVNNETESVKLKPQIETELESVGNQILIN